MANMFGRRGNVFAQPAAHDTAPNLFAIEAPGYAVMKGGVPLSHRIGPKARTSGLVEDRRGVPFDAHEYLFRLHQIDRYMDWLANPERAATVPSKPGVGWWEEDGSLSPLTRPVDAAANRIIERNPRLRNFKPRK